MRIPIFEEVIVKDITVKSLTYLFTQKKIGKGPVYISLHAVAPNKHQEAVDNIGFALEELRKHPHFPFVIYVISKAEVEHNTIQIAKNLEELPAHFLKKAKRLKNKEISLLNKLTLVGEMVENQDLYGRYKDLDQTFSHQKELYNLCKEDNFYGEILNQIKKDERQSNG